MSSQWFRTFWVSCLTASWLLLALLPPAVQHRHRDDQPTHSHHHHHHHDHSHHHHPVPADHPLQPGVTHQHLVLFGWKMTLPVPDPEHEQTPSSVVQDLLPGVRVVELESICDAPTGPEAFAPGQGLVLWVALDVTESESGHCNRVAKPSAYLADTARHACAGVLLI